MLAEHFTPGASDDVALVGFSMGGWLAAEIAVMRHETAETRLFAN